MRTGHSLWDNLVDAYASRCDRRTDWRLGVSQLVRMIGDRPGQIGLDYGSGTGDITRYIHEQTGASMIGIDASQRAVTLAQRVPAAGVSFRVGNMAWGRRLKYPVDFGVSLFVLCTMNDDDAYRTLHNVYDSLKRRAEFFVCDPHPDSPGRTFLSSRRSMAATKVPGAPVTVEFYDDNGGVCLTCTDRWRSRDAYEQLFTDVGFTITDVQEPILEGSETELEPWRDERRFPPNILFAMRKRR